MAKEEHKVNFVYVEFKDKMAHLELKWDDCTININLLIIITWMIIGL
jgi:hypothetical protein